MSGSSSSSFYGPAASVDCNKVFIRTHVSGANMEVLNGIQVGDKLDVVLQGTAGPIVIQTSREVLGAIITSEIVQLIECIINGHEYIATVKKIDGAECQIIIEHK